ncbi:hypothetical protein NDU88_000486 [Pleurodeles waltl]|uniref:Uncharacterized protein n=1 Tax=Pleurodeles waltl TaxID=8319 RepID=A0AAV7VX13_PLEWA|nr:hypothetical protein NDU88_000486 [Pleurodeles waltl]
METKGGVTRSRDSKDFFEEKQLVTLRPNTRWRAIAEHANLLRLMPRTDVHWVIESRTNSFVEYIDVVVWRQNGDKPRIGFETTVDF